MGGGKEQMTQRVHRRGPTSWPGGAVGTVGVSETQEGPLGHIKTAAEWEEYVINVKVGDSRRASGQLPVRLNLKAMAVGVSGHQGGHRANGGPSAHQASGLDSHAGIRGQKDNKSYFSCKRSWTSGKIRALCMTCQTAEARKCLGRGLRCELGTARSPWGAPAVNVRLLSGFSEREQEASAGVLPPPHGEDELVTWPWPDGPAPGTEPGCPEMSSGSLGDPSSFLCLWFGLGTGGLPRTPFLRDPSAPRDPSRCRTCRAFFGSANENKHQALNA